MLNSIKIYCLPCYTKLHQKVHRFQKEYQQAGRLDENSLNYRVKVPPAIQWELVNQANEKCDGIIKHHYK